MIHGGASAQVAAIEPGLRRFAGNDNHGCHHGQRWVLQSGAER